MRKVERRGYDLFFTKEEVNLLNNAVKLIEEIGEADDRGEFLQETRCICDFEDIIFEVTKIVSAMEGCID